MVFGFSKSKKKNGDAEEKLPKKKLFGKLGERLKRTRTNFTNGIANVVLGKKTIDRNLLEELETTLLLADVGAEASQEILDNLSEQVARKELTNPEALIDALRNQLLAILSSSQQPLTINTTPFVILMVGVNGVGKTTSIAKLAHYFQQQGKKVMLAAGDTFRAAAVEQLEVWGTRNNVPVIAQHSGADSAAVVFDAMHSAVSKNIDVLIADTAGRLHTQDHLMAELQKIKRVIGKVIPGAPHETMLVIDAGTGQNALNQADQFNSAIGLSGITLTKLDGTARGGIIFAIAKKMRLPIRFIGVGETIDDLRPFDAKQFVDALFEKQE
ncbi:signal recognition particle-docking protein FtsY [Candidiatus Paracoxiella cheracis]|uniref:signal recognition particle-docking protein FtsY n=1 Tax=Candidiatus Paracoxiella cheracis TaxID=3405120 RepID=UPI003BF546DD